MTISEGRSLPERPYTPDTLAQRWTCTPQHVRKLIRTNMLRAFRIGSLLRISADEVERYERCESGPMDTALSATAAPGQSSGTTATASDTAVRLVKLTPEPPRPRLVESSQKSSDSHNHGA